MGVCMYTWTWGRMLGSKSGKSKIQIYVLSIRVCWKRSLFRKLFEPKYYPKSLVFQVWDKYFGTLSQRNVSQVTKLDNIKYCRFIACAQRCVLLVGSPTQAIQNCSRNWRKATMTVATELSYTQRLGSMW